MKLQGWRLGDVIAFSVFALLELGDLVGLIPGFGNPQPYADLIGISADAERARLWVLSVLAGLIVLGSDLMVLALVLRAPWAGLASRAVALVFGLYGLYQVVAANVQLTKNQVPIMVAGGVYILLGGLAWWLGNKASRA